MLIAAAALTAVTASAQDKATLDLLVSKGVITPEDRAKTIQAGFNASVDAPKPVTMKEETTKNFKLGAYMQTFYENFAYSQTTAAGVQSSNYRTQSEFIIRRLYLTLDAALGEGFTTSISYDLSGQFPTTAYELDRAIISVEGTWGKLDSGWKKVNWGIEEVPLSSLFKDGSSSSNLYGIERSNADRYWQESEKGDSAGTTSNGRRLGLGFHHLGLFYSSPTTKNGFEYGAAVTNGVSSYYLAAPASGINDVAYYLNALYNYSTDDDHKLAVGVNFGHSPYYNTTGGVNTLAYMDGFNPFIMAKYGDWLFQAQYLSTTVNNTPDNTATLNGTTYGNHTPTGQTYILAYRLTPNWEGVLRYDHLNTDGRGVQIGDVVRDFGTVNTNDGTTAVNLLSTTSFNSVDSIYVGVNYYFSLKAGSKDYAGKNAKIMTGFQQSVFKDTVSGGAINGAGASATVNELRVCAQLAW